MRKIVDGYLKFQSEVYPEMRERFEQLSSAQDPEILFITCADSRVMPSLITQTQPGEIFACRNAGNIVPAYGDFNTGGVTATIEYAVMALRVSHIIVCGHSDCGAMRALVHPEKVSGLPSVAAWLRHAETARFVTVHNHAGAGDDELLDIMIQENVRAQMDNLETHPSVAARRRQGGLKLHGWVYDIGSGEVQVLNRESDRFEPFRQVYLKQPEVAEASFVGVAND